MSTPKDDHLAANYRCRPAAGLDSQAKIIGPSKSDIKGPLQSGSPSVNHHVLISGSGQSIVAHFPTPSHPTKL